MTDTQLDQAAAAVELKYEDLQLTWTANGLPFFTPPLREDATIKEVRKLVEAQGFTEYYFVGTERIPANKDHGVLSTTRIFKVMSNLVGATVVAVEEDLGFPVAETGAYYSMPGIPWAMVEKLDVFFREVDRIQHSEAIVMLTYKPEYLRSENPSDGWGLLVPEQVNNAAHCRYEPASVMANKDEDCLLVGTVHSHPGMDAFASGIDHADQKGFDGLHITFGWHGRYTEYHAEMQMGDETFILRPDQIFADIPGADPAQHPEVANWVHLVGSEIPLPPSSFKTYNKTWTLPMGCPDPASVALVARLLDNESLCPVCGDNLTDPERNGRRCGRCMSYLALEGETLETVLAARRRYHDKAIDSFFKDIDPSQNPYRPIVFWERFWTKINNTATMIKKAEILFHPSSASGPKV